MSPEPRSTVAQLSKRLDHIERTIGYAERGRDEALARGHEFTASIYSTTLDRLIEQRDTANHALVTAVRDEALDDACARTPIRECPGHTIEPVRGGPTFDAFCNGLCLPPALYFSSPDGDHSTHITGCCGDSAHRPPNGRPTDPWFCRNCGRSFVDERAVHEMLRPKAST